LSFSFFSLLLGQELQEVPEEALTEFPVEELSEVPKEKLPEVQVDVPKDLPQVSKRKCSV